MALHARAAAVRGDDFQYTLGWYHACEALTEPGIISVSVEDADAQSFDDVAVLREDGHHLYRQAKNSNYGNVPLAEAWLLGAKGKGKSPLRHYYDSWQALRHTGTPTFDLVTTRSVDPEDPLLKMRDLNTCLLMPKAAEGSGRTDVGKARKRWAQALGITEPELLEFLGEFHMVTTDNETAWRGQTKPLMRLAGLRHDDEAVRVGVDIVREWVKTGAGPRTPAQIRHEAGAAGLLAQGSRVVLAVHAIGHPSSSNLPTLKLDWVDRYDGDSDRTRRVLRDPAGWTDLDRELTAAEATLGEYGVRRVLVEGAMRLGVWFAVGAAFPETRRWQLETDQRGEAWSSDAAPEDDSHAARLLGERLKLDCESADAAVIVALTLDSRDDVIEFVTANDLASTLLTVTTQSGPGRDSIQDGAHARNWARSARELIRAQLKELDARPKQLHLFLAAPAGAALLLGHDWNLLPQTLVYEHTGTSYIPSMTVG